MQKDKGYVLIFASSFGKAKGYIEKESNKRGASGLYRKFSANVC
jgi:hypothetical protein